MVAEMKMMKPKTMVREKKMKRQRVATMRVCWQQVGEGKYTAEDKKAETAAIGYKVIGALQKNDQVFKPYEPVFAVVQLILNKVLLLGSGSQTIVGRCVVPDAAVHAVVEEHALDAKVIIFKKKRRRNYWRTKGHRQELTKLRITDIQGIEKPEKTITEKPAKAAKNKEKVAIAA